MSDLDDDYVVQGYSGKSRMQSQLRDAFNRVANKENWKLPVKAEVEVNGACDMALIRDAVIHFTGSIPTFTTLGGNRYRVEAQGYYIKVGA